MGVSRRAFLVAAAAAAGCRPRDALMPSEDPLSSSPSSPSSSASSSGGRQPVLFVGHGSPMNAILDTPWGRGWRALGETLRPTAIVSISAHWFIPGTFATGDVAPATIHDFGGFPRPLFAVQYPAKGQPTLAERVAALVRTSPPATTRTDWGLDHGTWSVLVHLRPAADVPVVQLSIDSRLSPAAHLELGRSLAPLRDEGVLVMGTGSITHNLGEAMAQLRRGDRSTHPWASRFDRDVAAALEDHDHRALLRFLDTDDGHKNHPTPEHWLPLLYAVGAAGDDQVSWPTTGFDDGSLSMRSVRFG
jgi:4,5-DOPA dioxygenase extradiol